MPRANRISVPGLIWHVTHRCHKREFLLKFSCDRRRWRNWLYEARRRYGLCVLDYIATSNHVHLLLADRGAGEISTSMQLVAGQVAQEYNRRKKRNGAFWEDRYHATAVQTNEHLVRCIAYIDLNMVRAGAVNHPSEWEICGYNEIQTPRPRKGVVNHEALCAMLGSTTIQQLAFLHKGWVDDDTGGTKRDPVWTESVGVGDEDFLSGLKSELGRRATRRQISRGGSNWYLRDGHSPYSAILDPK